MLNVAYKVTLGTDEYTSGDAAAPVLAVRSEAAFAVPVNACRIALHGLAQVSAAAGDPVSVQLGYGDALETVFTGTVASVQHGLGRIEVEAVGALAQLAAWRVNLLYEQETAGGIVSDVLGQLNIATGTVETGIKLPAFAMDDGRSAWAHLRGLAARCGFDFWADAEDKTQFRAYDPATTHALAYGADLLAWEHDARPAAWEGVEVLGESPAGQGQGDDASDWLTKQDVKGTAGETSGRILRIADPAARTPNLAADVAAGTLVEWAAKTRGTARVLGAPAIQLGDAVSFDKLPASDQNGDARVTAVRHRLDARGGFVTTLAWERA
ncbi:MAG TPA: hypothetical protein VFS20_28655 [Longimicrobium sp.]|nr:hypothetical protein [Longimicrobium sp.]